MIQDAYDTLSDPQRRREYDSVDDFDDSLPFDCAPADFFKARPLLGLALKGLLSPSTIRRCRASGVKLLSPQWSQLALR